VLRETGRARIRRAAAAAALLAFISDARAIDAGNVCEREMLRSASASDVPVGVLYAVALTETGHRGALHAYAMNIEGQPKFNATLQEALGVFEAARRRGARLIDVGCMQVNHHFHGRNFASVDEMFDPRKNVDYAAKFLRNLRASEGSWTAAVARYHAGPGNVPAQKSYVCAVIGNMVASGFGGWTQQSKSFCGK
jgi:soluble lytic murein transglycosylase-like protein